MRDNVITVKYNNGEEIQISEDKTKVEIISVPIINEYKKDNKNFIAFANTLSYQNISARLGFDTRKTDSIYSDFTMSLNEYFQSYFYFVRIADHLRGYDSSGNNITDKLFCGINLNIRYDENSTKMAGNEFQGGYGELNNILASWIIGAAYQEDIVFNKLKNWSEIIGFQIGHTDDIHFIFHSLNILDVLDVDYHPINTMMPELNIEAVLGWKRFLPIFFKYYTSVTAPRYFINSGDGYNIYEFSADKSMFHIQYYGKRIDFSLGYTYYWEEFSVIKYDNDERQISHSTIKEAKYNGGGFTAAIKNIFDTNTSLFGEFHLLADKNMSFITISNIGIRLSF